MISNLQKIIKSLQGKLIMFGIKDNTLFDEVDNNNHITYCDLINCKLEGDGTGNKKYKKKSIDYMIVNIDNTKSELNKLIRDSVYVVNNKIYLYGQKDELDKALKKYHRYTTSIQNKNNILIIDVSNLKVNIIKNYFNYILDICSNITDLISELLD